MKSAKRQSLHGTWNIRKSGFSLVELLVVISIVMTLSALVFVLTNRARLAAAKATAVGQMRSIGVAAASWASDNGKMEPFYFSNGTGDYPHEAGGGGTKFTPGNPAKALYNSTAPDAGYLQNPADLFSPLVKTTVPLRKTYSPDKASAAAIWGTYAWYYPYMSASHRGNRYPEVTGTFPNKVNVAVEGRYMMSECYAYSKPKFGKPVYNALMVDGSVQAIGESDAVFNKWKSGD